MYRPSAERTRSKSWRSGTRRNKRLRTAHVAVCPMPKVCLVHRLGDFPRHPAMAMKLTRCEQAWVDDVRAGRIHVHLTSVLPAWQSKLLLLRQRINTARMKAEGIVNEASSPTGRLPTNRQPVMQQIRIPEEASSALNLHLHQQSLARRMDISDRWYPRGS